MITYLILGAGFAFAAAVQPGPFQAFLLAQTLHRGWRRTVPAAFAPLLSDGPILVVALLVLSRVPPHLVRFLHLAGAGFLFYLAWGTWRTFRQPPEPDADASAGGGTGTLLKATVVNFLNPNPWLGWSLVMGPMFLQGYREEPVRGVALLVGFYVTMVASLVVLIGVFAQARRLDARLRRATLGVSVAALAGFACYQLYLGLAGHS
jgi:threonine/homoserine/homoserine lactone efflux protein